MEKQPCSIDLCDIKEVIQHFRDFLNVGPLLDMDYELEMLKFKRQLFAVGYNHERIQQMLQLACFGTIYEAEIPPPIKNRGDYWEYLKNKSRTR
ncbi:MAG: hypothetical protein QQN45_06675 [Nitrosopumilus sp.]